MQALFSNKLFLIAFVALCVLIPLNMIDGLVAERQAYQQHAINDMSATSTSAQRVIGPVLLLPCSETYQKEVYDRESKTNRMREAKRDCTKYALPASLNIHGALLPDIRKRGIYSALFYTGDLHMRARFVAPEKFGSGEAATRVKLGAPSLNVGLGDTRGILNVPSVSYDDTQAPFKAGALIPALGTGIHAEINRLAPGESIDVTFTIKVRGLERLDIVPVGQQTEVSLSSPWRHPSFVGKFLPTRRDIGDAGFNANWSTSHFSTNLEQLFDDHLHETNAGAIKNTSFGVTLIDPVDLYTQADRAVKYGFLFVLLTFIALLGTELSQNLRLHPVQYAMVGVALAMFFLLLLSFAEHIGFKVAYLLASGSCVALLGYYLRHVLGNTRIGSIFSLTLMVLYGLLYSLLASEDFALLTGALVVFSVVAGLMILTRNIDWYALSVEWKHSPAKAEPVTEAPGV